MKSSSMWEDKMLGNTTYQLLNINHPEVEALVIEDMMSGVSVFYDTRWKVTDLLVRWLVQNDHVYSEKKVLVLGAGVGVEQLVIGKKASHVYLNDLSPTALKLSTMQMVQNDLEGKFSLIEGKYEEIEDLPDVDLLIGSFLVYDRETLASMDKFIRERAKCVILMNENLKYFTELCKRHQHRVIFSDDQGSQCVILSPDQEGLIVFAEN